MNHHENMIVTTYANDKVCMAVCMDDSVITVNLGHDIGNMTIMPKYCAFLDTNNCPKIDNYLKDKKIAEPYMRFGSPVMGYSGFCEYPLYRFDKEKLIELGAKGLDSYEKEYDKAFPKVQNEMFGNFGLEEEMEEPDI